MLNNITVIIPARNEEKPLPILLKRLKKITNNIIVVDDGSTDNTLNVAKKYCKVLRNEVGRGKGYALRKGCKEVKTPIIVTMDADLSHKPSDIERLVEPLKDKRIGLVLASRVLGGSEEYTPTKAFGNFLITVAFNLFFNTKITDAINGFKAFRKDIAKNLRCNGFNIEIEFLGSCIRKGYKIVEVPSYEIARRSGKSKLNKIMDGLTWLYQVVVEFYKTTF